MQSLFELKTKITPDLTVFECMKEKAIELLSDAEKSEYTQAIVLYSVAGNAYSTIIRNALSEEKADEASLLRKIQEAKDNEISFVLCMWQDKCIDIPSFAFRKSLLELTEKNSESTLFVMTADGVFGIKLSATMK
ncbi:MAG: hypothetical protein J6A83_01305 [Clostridia bacterium]|nr:hypothetical protein [Clostridia bacterium]